LPVYNGERFLRETFESILGQTFRDFELIVSDNASTDATAEICREYEARDPRVRYFRNETNIGMAPNLRRVIALSSGQYFKLANADDVSAPRLVEKCVSVLDQRPEVILCYGRTTLINEHGAPLRPYDDRLDLRQPRAVDRFRQAQDRIGLVNVPQGVMRLEALRRTGLVGNYVGSDVVLVVELALHGQFFELPEPLFFRRIHAGAFSSLPTLESRQEHVDPIRKRRFFLILWRHQVEYARAVLRAPVSLADKGQLLWRALRRAVVLRHELIGELSATVFGARSN